MYTNIIRTNKWLLSNRADPDFDRIDERVTPQKKNANKILNNPPIVYRTLNFRPVYPGWNEQELNKTPEKTMI